MLFSIFRGNVNWSNHYRKQRGGYLIPPLGVCPKEIKTGSLLEIFTFILWQCYAHPKCPLMDEWGNSCGRYMMKYYAAVGKEAILSFATTRMDLEDIMLSEIRQTETA